MADVENEEEGREDVGPMTQNSDTSQAKEGEGETDEEKKGDDATKPSDAQPQIGDEVSGAEAVGELTRADDTQMEEDAITFAEEGERASLDPDQEDLVVRRTTDLEGIIVEDGPIMASEVTVTSTGKAFSEEGLEDEAGDLVDAGGRVSTEMEFVDVEEEMIDDLGQKITITQRLPVLQSKHHYIRRSVIRVSDSDEDLTQSSYLYFDLITKTIKRKDQTGEEFLEEIAEEVPLDDRPMGVPVYKQIKMWGFTREEEIDFAKEEEKKKQNRLERQHRIETMIRRKEEAIKKRENAAKAAGTDEEYVPKLFKVMESVLSPTGAVEEKTTFHLKEVLEKKTLADSADEDDLEEFGEFDEEYVASFLEEGLPAHVRKVNREVRERKRQEEQRALEEEVKMLVITYVLEKKRHHHLMKLNSLINQIVEKHKEKSSKFVKKKSKKERKVKKSLTVAKKEANEEALQANYLKKLMEFREVRSAFLVRVNLEKRKMTEMKQRYNELTVEVEELRKQFAAKLTQAAGKLKPKDDAFKQQVVIDKVNRLLDLEKRTFEKTKVYLEELGRFNKINEIIEKEMSKNAGVCEQYKKEKANLDYITSLNDKRMQRLSRMRHVIEKDSCVIRLIEPKLEALQQANGYLQSEINRVQDYLTSREELEERFHYWNQEMKRRLEAVRGSASSELHPHLVKQYRLCQCMLEQSREQLTEWRKSRETPALPHCQ